MIKAVAEDGPLHLRRIGAPFGVDIVDWPLGMWLPFGLAGALVAVFGHAGTAINVYWLSSVVATGITAMWALLRLSLSRPTAFVFGLLYAFLPHGFYRNVMHVNMVFPFVPLLGLLCLHVAAGRPETLGPGERRVLLGACVAQGLSYVYYAFFGCILLGAATLAGWFKTRRLAPLRLGALGVLLLASSSVMERRAARAAASRSR